MAWRGANVTGIDLAEAPLAVARLHALDSGAKVEYDAISTEDYAEAHAGEFDVVTCLEMLEHVPSPGSIIEACAKLVKPGGHVFFSTITRSPKSYLFAIVGAEYVLKLLPKGTHEYNKFITPAEMDKDCRAAKLAINDMIGLSYNPFNKRYKLGSDISVNYMAYYTRSADA